MAVRLYGSGNTAVIETKFAIIPRGRDDTRGNTAGKDLEVAGLPRERKCISLGFYPIHFVFLNSPEH
jgi:hypothetical protein